MSRPPRRSAGSTWAGAAIVLLALGLTNGCGPGQPSRWNLRPTVERPRPAVVVFLVDGLPPRFVEWGCADGSLPNIRRRFCDGGVRVERATTSVPAITYAAIATLLTGVGPGRHQIVGNRWFDPDARLFRNYATIEHYRDVNTDFETPTIYERIDPAASVSVQAAHRRGVTKNIANWALSGTMWFFGDFTAVDKLTASSIWRITRWANRQGRWPTLLTLYFPGLDSVGHEVSPSSTKFRWAVWHADWQVGRVCDWLERQGLLETTYLVLVSDHGMIDVRPEGFIDLVALVRDGWGRRVTDEMRQDGSFEQRARFYDAFDTVVAHQDGRGASLHFRGPAGWDTPPSPDLVEAVLHSPPEDLRLWNIRGVELVAYLASTNGEPVGTGVFGDKSAQQPPSLSGRGWGRVESSDALHLRPPSKQAIASSGRLEVVLRSAAGSARILTQPGPGGDEFAYVPDDGDVLGYLADPDLAAFVAAGFHPSRAWLAATADQRLPDVVPHLPPLLHVRRAGQVVVFAAPGYSFVREAGGHGGLDRDERLMTFLLAGPGIEPGTVIATARSVDLVPTLLDLLGVEYDEDEWLEGVSLLNIPRLSPADAGVAP